MVRRRGRRARGSRTTLVRSGLRRPGVATGLELDDVLGRRGRGDELVTVQRVARAAAERGGDLLGQAHTRRHLGMAFGQLGQYAEAQTELLGAFKLAARAGDDVAQANIAHNVAWVFDQQDRYADAMVYVQQALTLFQRAGHGAGQARTLNAIGWAQTRLGDPRAALRNCERALEMLTELTISSPRPTPGTVSDSSMASSAMSNEPPNATTRR